MVKINTLEIDSFRHLKSLYNISLGEKLTIISGENGTGKSSLLGLIGHIFTYQSRKTIDNMKFETLFSEVFRFSPEKDINNIYRYRLTLSDRTEKKAESRYIEGEKRFRIDVGGRQKGKGKILKPVIYLGLKRLFPLAQERAEVFETSDQHNLDECELRLYQEWHNKILVMDDNVIPQRCISKNKNITAPSTHKYDVYGNSAGQDNISQIIMALLSFRREMMQQGDSYTGGILLIDEVDATLYPAAQRNLMDVFHSACRKFNIQIVMTTHSLDIIDYVFRERQKEYAYSTKIIFLHRQAGTIAIIQESENVLSIAANLKHIPLSPTRDRKVNIYFEDDEARSFFRGIISQEIRQKINIQKNNLGGDVYKSLISQKFPEFRHSIVVLDGDKKSDGKSNKKNRQPRLVYLPGDKSPEKVFLDFLSNLPEVDEFWSRALGGYDKLAFINKKPDSNDRVAMKKWFNSQKRFWGRDARKLIKRWARSNPEEISNFIDTFSKVLDSIRKEWSNNHQ